jgi:Fur family transcriptional regulator, ferric uptake regulator
MRKLRASLRYSHRVPRPSPVTDEVRRLLTARDRHAWALDELHEAVQASLGSADFSSVFRAAAYLEREGLIDRIELGDGRSRYELREGHHEHVRCDGCGRVDEVPGCVLDDAAGQVERITGFTVTSHRVVFAGLCQECASAAWTGVGAPRPG